MSDFLHAPRYGAPRLTREGMLRAVGVRMVPVCATATYSEARVNRPAPAPVGGCEVGWSTGRTEDPGPFDEAAFTAKEARLQAELSAGQSALATLQAAVVTKRAAYAEALGDQAAVRFTLYECEHASTILAARLEAESDPDRRAAIQAQQAAALARYLAAKVAYNAALTATGTAHAAYEGAQNDLRFGGGGGGAAQLQLALLPGEKAFAMFSHQCAQENRENYLVWSTPGNPENAYRVKHALAVPGNESILGYCLGEGAHSSRQLYDQGPPEVYETISQSYDYRPVLDVPADVLAAMTDAGLSLRLRWSEVATTPEGGFARTEVSEDFDPADAQDYGPNKVLVGAKRTLSAPTPTDEVGAVTYTLTGTARLPRAEVLIQQARGGERYRQGWHAFGPEEEGQPHRRFLRMEAGGGTPGGATYQGALTLRVPTAEDVDPDGEPTCDFPTRFGASAPLAIFSTLSEATREAIGGESGTGTYPANEYTGPERESDDATLLSATRRQMTAPAGLTWTLGDEQTAADIWAAVNEDASAPWLPDHPAPGGTAQSPPSVGIAGAISFRAPGGDYCVRQNLRFKLAYDSQDTRPEGESNGVTFRWAYRRRNLLTGVVTTEEHSRQVTFPVDAAHAGNAGSRWATRDEEWTEVEAGENETLELVMLRGENGAPRLSHVLEGNPGGHYGDGNPANYGGVLEFVEAGEGGGGDPTPL